MPDTLSRNKGTQVFFGGVKYIEQNMLNDVEFTLLWVVLYQRARGAYNLKKNIHELS